MTQPRLVGGRYELGELIGYGGMAEVHRGRDVRLGRDVAIKVLRADLARDPSFLNRFRREAQSAAGLNHPSIVSVYDTGEDVGAEGTSQPYIVMEFVEGRTLRDILKAEGTAAAAARDGDHRRRLGRARLQPPRRAGAPRRQAGQRDDHPGRRGQGDGLRHRPRASPTTRRPSRRRRTSSAPRSTCRPSRRAAKPSTRARTSTPPVACSTNWSPECRRSKAIRRSRSPTSTCARTATAPSSRVPDLPRGARLDRDEGAGQEPAEPLPERRRDAQRPAARAGRPAGLGRIGDDRRRAHPVHRAHAAAAGRAAAPRRTASTTPSTSAATAVIWVAIVVALLLVVGAGAFFIWKLGDSNKPHAEVTVPSLIGLSPAAANTKLGNPTDCDTTNTCKVYLQPSPDSADHARPVRRRLDADQGRRDLQAAAGQRDGQCEHRGRGRLDGALRDRTRRPRSGALRAWARRSVTPSRR